MVQSNIDEGKAKPREMSFVEKVNRINKLIDMDEIKLEHKKRFKLGFGKKPSRGQLKKNWIIAFILKTNGQMIVKKLRVQDNMVYIKETQTYHSVKTDDVFIYDGKFPAIILPEWSLEPVSQEMLTRQVMEQGSWSFPQKVLINAMKKAEIKQKGPIGNILIWVVLGLGGLYLISQIITGGK